MGTPSWPALIRALIGKQALILNEPYEKAKVLVIEDKAFESEKFVETLKRDDDAVTPVRSGEQGIALASRVGLNRTYGAYLTGNLAESLFRLGRLADAERAATEAQAVATEGVFAGALMQMRARIARIHHVLIGGRYRQLLQPHEQPLVFNCVPLGVEIGEALAMAFARER